MTANNSFPNPKKVEKTIIKMREVCHQFDLLNLALDELIAQIELDINNSLLTAYRQGKNHPLSN